MAKILIPKTIQRILGKFGFKGVGGEEIPVSRRVLLFYELSRSEWRDGVGASKRLKHGDHPSAALRQAPVRRVGQERGVAENKTRRALSALREGLGKSAG
jgi:hypothetical protein